MSTENFSQRTRRASVIFQDVLNGGAKKENDPNTITILVDPEEKKDEGDFSGLSMILGFMNATDEISEKNKNLSDEEKFVERVENLIDLLASNAKKSKSSFVGKNYVPFMLEMKQRGYVKPFAYLVLTNAGNTTAAKWVASENTKTVVEFMNWAKNYQPPR